MTTQIGASVFVDPSEITHSVIDNCPVITFGPYPTVNRVDVHLRNVAGIDAVIAELVALKQEMAPPVPKPSLTRALCACGHGGIVHAGAEPFRCLNKRCACMRFGPAAVITDSEPAPVEFTTSSLPGHSSARCLHPYEHSDNLTGAVVDCDVADHHAITDSERTCDQANPDSGAWCHRGGDHGVHEDTDGETWRTDGAAKQSPRPADLCTCGHLPADHHFNGVAGKYTDCNVCDIAACDVFQPAERAQALASVTS